MKNKFEFHCENLGRRFNYEWIFRNFTYSFTEGNAYAILGPNGSGKSTLIQTLSGFLSSSEGKLIFKNDEKEIDDEKIYQFIALASPYLELVEEFTLAETISFHAGFKKFLGEMNANILAEKIGLEKHTDKQIRFFSSGMKQRLKLALAVFSDVPVLFLDEPTTNLDADGVAWYQQLMKENNNDRIIIVGSNQQHEYEFCRHKILMTDLKS